MGNGYGLPQLLEPEAPDAYAERDTIRWMIQFKFFPPPGGWIPMMTLPVHDEPGTWTCIRCGETRLAPFDWGHRPLNSGIRTCGGTVVRTPEVDRVRAEEQKRMYEQLLRIGVQEAGWR